MSDRDYADELLIKSLAAQRNQLEIDRRTSNAVSFLIGAAVGGIIVLGIMVSL